MSATHSVTNDSQQRNRTNLEKEEELRRSSEKTKTRQYQTRSPGTGHQDNRTDSILDDDGDDCKAMTEED